MELTLPGLRIDFGAGGPDDEIALVQDFGGNEHMVTVHREQLRLIAERTGLLPAQPVTPADVIVARLARQLRALKDRISTMHSDLLHVANKGHEDVSSELTEAGAALDLACEWVAQLDELNTPIPGVIGPGNPPNSGAVREGNPPKSGGASRAQRLREVRTLLLVDLQAKGITPDKGIGTSDLRQLHAQHRGGGAAK